MPFPISLVDLRARLIQASAEEVVKAWVRRQESLDLADHPVVRVSAHLPDLVHQDVDLVRRLILHRDRLILFKNNYCPVCE